jgi:antitoxin component YwqK of YwqJK toxin-antitoxin module
MLAHLSHAQSVNEKNWPNGSPKLRETLDKKGFKTGECTYWYENGQMKLRESYERGRRTGTCEAWFEDGTPQYRRAFVVMTRGNGSLAGTEPVSVRHGEWVEHHYNGQKMKEEHYVEGVLQGEVRTWYENGQLEEVKTMEDKFENGPYKRYFEDGQLHMEGRFAKGEKTGEWKTWHRNGQLAFSDVFVSDKHIDGPWVGKHANGADSLSGSYSNGRMNGIWTASHPNGRLKSKTLYRDNMPVGEFVEFYANGNKRLEGAFGTSQNDGQRQREEGLWKEWHENGQLMREATYDDGRLVGHCQEWYPNGQKRFETNYVIAGRKDEMMDGMTREWYEDGALMSEGAYTSGLRDGLWKEYYPGGQLMSEAIFDRSKASGAVTVYHPNGNKRSTGFYEVAGRRKKRTGHWTEWYVDGTMQSEGEYVSNKRQGRWREWHENGKIKEDAFFEDGVYQGAYKSFHPNGELMVEGTYRGERNHQGLAYGEWKYFDEGGSLLRSEFWYNGRKK